MKDSEKIFILTNSPPSPPAPKLDERVVLGRVWWTSLTALGILGFAGAVAPIFYVALYHKDLSENAIGACLGLGIPFAVVLGGLTLTLAYDATMAWFAPNLFLQRWYTSATGLKSDKNR